MNNRIAALIALLACSSCSVVVGNVRPVDEKSDHYGVMDLSVADPDWLRLDQARAASNGGREQNLSSTEVADVAYQSKSTASIISLDSACRSADSMDGEDLETLTNVLFLGMTDVTLRKEQTVQIQRTPALETTIRGTLGGEPMAFRTVVLRRDHCVYDLVYMAQPSLFTKHEQDFSHFVASLKLKE